MEKTVLFVSADCNCSGIEIRDPERDFVMTDPAELGLTQQLRFELHFWQRWFDGVFNTCSADDRYAALGEKFDEVGMGLAKRIAEQLGSTYQVVYEAQGGWRLSKSKVRFPVHAHQSDGSAGVFSSPCAAPPGHWDEDSNGNVGG